VPAILLSFAMAPALHFTKQAAQTRANDLRWTHSAQMTMADRDERR
jgi:hypothetical protein